MKRILYIIVALFIFTTVAGAQGRNLISDNDAFTGPLPPIEHSFKTAGVELSTGTFDKIDDKCWGNSYVVAGDDGSMAVQFTISLDYVSGLPNAENGNSATRGNWAMAVYQDSRYQGTIYGDLVVGFLSWKIRDGLINHGFMNAKLRITGGTGAYESIGSNSGEVILHTNYTLAKPVTSATLLLTF